MDNLTHSLAGAVLGQMGLKRKTGLAMPALIIAANLPDIDAVCTVFGIESLAMRRGLTHGPIALALLPVLLWGLLIAFDGLQARRGKRPNKRLPIHRGWLLALCYIGTISHPALDWLNNYGIRLLEPFSSQWAYGDTLFIIDIWVWAALIIAVWTSLRREKRGGDWQRPAWIGFAAIGAYILANGLITGQAEGAARLVLQQREQERSPGVTLPDPLVVASPVPVLFWQRDIMWRDAVMAGSGSYAVGKGLTLPNKAQPHNAADPRLAAFAQSDPQVRAFLFWSRMPVARFDADGTLTLTDQRFPHPLSRGNFSVIAKPKAR